MPPLTGDCCSPANSGRSWRTSSSLQVRSGVVSEVATGVAALVTDSERAILC